MQGLRAVSLVHHQLNQRRARLQCMKVVLSVFAYDNKDEEAVGTVDPDLVTTGLGYLERKTIR